jgi:hypothetical protein
VTPELLALLLAVVAGVPLAMLLHRRAAGSLVAGEGILLGIAASSAVLLVLAVVHVTWSRGVFVGGVLGVATVAWIWVARTRGRDVGAPQLRNPATPRPRDPQRDPATSRPATITIHLATLALVTGYALFATIAPMWEFDFIGDFGIKASTFWEARTIDWSFLEHASHRVVHPDYPPLLPLAFDTFALMRGGWNDSAVGLITVAFAVALLLVIHRLALEETGAPLMAAFVTFAMVPFACSPWIGLAEGPLVAYGTVALLLIRRGDLTPGAVMLGLAASTKNEGLTLIAAAAVGLIVARRWRELPRLWPAVAIPLPWLILRRLHGLTTDITQGNVVARVFEHLLTPGPLLDALLHYGVGKRVYWLFLAIGIAVAIATRRFLPAERFVLVTLALQFAFYIGAYLASPHDLDWHVRWSWERLVSHLSPALTYVVLVTLLRRRPLTNGELVPML